MQTRVRGLTFQWRPAKGFDALRVSVYHNTKPLWIKAKKHSTLNEINEYLKAKGLKQETAGSDNHFNTLKQRLVSELQSEYKLKSYIIEQKLELKTREFSFVKSLEKFVDNRSQEISCVHNYKSILLSFWFPFFIKENGCEHPSDFIKWKRDIEDHIKSAKKRNGQKFSVNSYSGLTSALNEYMRYLLKKEYITQDKYFEVHIEVNKTEQQKRGKYKQARTLDTYSLEELFSIKEKIDNTYKIEKGEAAESVDRKHTIKRRAYAFYLGLCTGLRRGNILGLKAVNLHPHNEVPHIATKGNIVSGWSRTGTADKMILENSTKTFKGSVSLPLILPDTKTLQDVCDFLIEHTPKGEYLIECYPDSVARFWRQISKECGFKFLHPHAWKHTYATIGGANMRWYGNDPLLLQLCCMHSKFETTLKYINNDKDQLLRMFKNKLAK